MMVGNWEEPEEETDDGQPDDDGGVWDPLDLWALPREEVPEGRSDRTAGAAEPETGSGAEQTEQAEPPLDALRAAAGKLAREVARVKATLPADDVTETDRIALLTDQMQTLQDYVRSATATPSEHDALLHKLAGEVAVLHAAVSTLARTGETLDRTAFEIIGQGLLVAIVGAIGGGAAAGPVLAYVLHEPLHETILEGVITGALGAVAGEIAILLAPGGRTRR